MNISVCRRLSVVLFSFTGVFLLSACNQPMVSKSSVDFVFNNVNVVDVASGTVIPEQAVVISKGEIIKIQPSLDYDAPEGVKIIEGAGKYLVPGLSDMHAHAIHQDELTGYLVNGVTTIRNMWGEGPSLKMREALNQGEIVGPRYTTAGSLIDGSPRIWPASLEGTDAAFVAQEVKRQAILNYDFIKVYSRLKPDIFKAIVDAAQEHNMEVSGHVPQDMDLNDAMDMGMRTSEHLIGLIGAVMADDQLPNPDFRALDPRAVSVVQGLGNGSIDREKFIDPVKLAALIKRLKETDHWLVPTLGVMSNFTTNPHRVRPEYVRYFSANSQKLFSIFSQGSMYPAPPEVMAGEDIIFEMRGELLAQISQQGGKILFGTDNPMAGGFSVVDEMQALVDVGMSNANVLRSATLEMARYLDQEGKIGEIKTGAVADMILISGNPLDNIDELRNIHGVMLGDSWYDREALDGMLEKMATKSATILSKFSDAPMLPSDLVESADFIDTNGQPMRIALKSGDENGPLVSGAVYMQDKWQVVSASVGGEGIIVNKQGLGEAAIDTSLILTGTPMDIHLLKATVGTLNKGQSKKLQLTYCAADFNCSSGQKLSATITGLGRDIIFAHGHFEDAYAHRVELSDGRKIEYWAAGPGFFGGGPLRITVDGKQTWQRVM